MARKSTALTFPGADGSQLAARLDTPEGPPLAYALLAHCFTCSKDLKSLARVSAALVERGYSVLRFDFTGLGESEGDFADTHFSSNLDDLVAAADYLREHYQAPPPADRSQPGRCGGARGCTPGSGGGRGGDARSAE